MRIRTYGVVRGVMLKHPPTRFFVPDQRGRREKGATHSGEPVHRFSLLRAFCRLQGKAGLPARRGGRKRPAYNASFLSLSVIALRLQAAAHCPGFRAKILCKESAFQRALGISGHFLRPEGQLSSIPVGEMMTAPGFKWQDNCLV